MEFNKIDLNLLNVFDAIFVTRSLTVTASQLQLSQPSISRQLARLREMLDDRLFVRTRDGMAPTPRAEALAGPIRQAIRGASKAIEQHMGFNPRSSARRFCIYMSDLGQLVLLPTLLERIFNEAPGVSIHTVQLPEPPMRSMALESGEVDLAVGCFKQFDKSIRKQVLFEEHYIGMVRANHPTIYGNISFDQFLTSPQIVFQPSGGGQSAPDDFIDKACALRGSKRRVSVRVAHAMGLSSIISGTDLLVIVPHHLALACRAMADVALVELPIQVPGFTVAQYWGERFHTDPGNVWLRGLFRELFAQRLDISRSDRNQRAASKYDETSKSLAARA